MTTPLNAAPVALHMTLDDLTCILTALSRWGDAKTRMGLDSAAVDDLYDALTAEAWAAAADHARNQGIAVEGDEYDWDGTGF